MHRQLTDIEVIWTQSARDSLLTSLRFVFGIPPEDANIAVSNARNRVRRFLQAGGRLPYSTSVLSMMRQYTFEELNTSAVRKS